MNRTQIARHMPSGMDTEGLSFLDEKKDEDNSALFMDEDESEANDDGKYKVVKFAEDEAQKHDAERDQERSRQELLSKIARLTESFSEAQQQIKDEKDKRKKKEKSLLKLAKELKKRNLAREKDEDRLEELEEKKKYLEHHWVLAQKELDQEKALHAKLQEETQKEYEEVIKDEKNKLERTTNEHESRLADLKKAHIEQCEDLTREAMKAKLEADRLHKELAARGMDVPRHTVFNEKELPKKGISEQAIVLFLFAILSIAYASLGNLSSDAFTKSGICAPVIPGTAFDDNAYGVFQAPWWAPAPVKESAFASLCTTDGDVSSSIEWSRDGKNNKLSVSVNGSVVLKRSIAKAEVKSNKIMFSKRNGSIEEVPFNWVTKK